MNGLQSAVVPRLTHGLSCESTARQQGSTSLPDIELSVMPQAVHIHQASSRAFRIAFVSLPQIKAGVGNKCSQSAAAEDLPGQMDASDRLNIYEELRERKLL